MFHSSTPSHNKDVVLTSMTEEAGIVRVVFATTALGMGVNFVGLYSTIHYGAPRSLDDYFQVVELEEVKNKLHLRFIGSLQMLQRRLRKIPVILKY